jgi:hypothetical protein
MLENSVFTRFFNSKETPAISNMIIYSISLFIISLITSFAADKIIKQRGSRIFSLVILNLILFIVFYVIIKKRIIKSHTLGYYMVANFLLQTIGIFITGNNIAGIIFILFPAIITCITF